MIDIDKQRSSNIEILFYSLILNQECHLLYRGIHCLSLNCTHILATISQESAGTCSIVNIGNY